MTFHFPVPIQWFKVCSTFNSKTLQFNKLPSKWIMMDPLIFSLVYLFYPLVRGSIIDIAHILTLLTIYTVLIKDSWAAILACPKLIFVTSIWLWRMYFSLFFKSWSKKWLYFCPLLEWVFSLFLIVNQQKFYFFKKIMNNWYSLLNW